MSFTAKERVDFLRKVRRILNKNPIQGFEVEDIEWEEFDTGTEKYLKAKVRNNETRDWDEVAIGFF